ncbi:UbiA family prenyltransferase [Desulfopila inferna]|mgnify:CR=1 FL=1|uniref:UbiA family prenyltransferase n=1 Tax=Desulfopila inferna TaxID=468528 RepID=UPI0019632451|nr:UbiA family prenyltransferase [Desulfopila inferna]MBM9605643.1 UbiA family prenyltransferase [Desulfopila inferna]
MNVTESRRVSRLKLFMALSRTPHGLLDMCTPLLAALLWLGRPPEPEIIVLGMIAAFAGYTAVYALNDIVDYENDKKKIIQSGFHRDTGYLDASFIRHPLAQGFLSMTEAVVWTASWMMISLTSAYLLNPICALILIVGCALEILYCLLLQVSHLRTMVSGVVKTLGGLAAVFAVDASPDPMLLLLIFSWLFLWEIGGQNVPADWHDIQEDITLQARTVPVSLGARIASMIVLGTLSASLILGGVLFLAAPLRFPLPFYLGTILAGLYLLILPALRLFRTRDRDEASALFNRASYYPCVLFILTLATLTPVFR